MIGGAAFSFIKAPQAQFPSHGLVVLVTGSLGLVLFNRQAALLPAAVRGGKLRLREAWRATTGQNLAFFTLGLLILVGSLALLFAYAVLIVMYLAIIEWAWEAASYWLKLMNDLSLLTAISSVGRTASHIRAVHS